MSTTWACDRPLRWKRTPIGLTALAYGASVGHFPQMKNLIWGKLYL